MFVNVEAGKAHGTVIGIGTFTSSFVYFLLGDGPLHLLSQSKLSGLYVSDS